MLSAAAELRDLVERIFEPALVVAARPHPLRSSCPLTRIELRSPDGSLRTVLMKQLSRAARHPGPPEVHDERREIEVYDSLLRHDELGTARFLGSHVDSDRDHYLLFIEEVEGIPLWQSGDERAWRAAASWLADLHSTSAPSASAAIEYDERFYAQWLPRALRLAPEAGLERLAETHRQAMTRLAAAPRAFVHGDFYSANVLLRTIDGVPTVCPVDFELAGVGSAALDLAALVTGLPETLAAAIFDEYRARCMPACSDSELEQLVLCARLHLAVRWLGWLDGWQAPDHQAFDWAAEAHTVAAELGGLP